MQWKHGEIKKKKNKGKSGQKSFICDFTLLCFCVWIFDGLTYFNCDKIIK